MDNRQGYRPDVSVRRLLDTINNPQELKKLPPELLPQLAQEIREKIISTVAKTGGHLAPSLGVVELTIALHYVFDCPRDKIVWDVGHQAYAHKLLTGRQDRFHTLRQHGGLSGFPKRGESCYDAFDTGHSSTSISAALGMASARCLKRERHRVIAVIGDGSMTAGMAFEGLNNAGDLNKDLIVVLNDNGMSIAPNVGAMSSFFSRKLTRPTMVFLKKQVENLLRSLPAIGEDLVTWAKRSEESFKAFFTPGMLFEALKFTYLGPVNGHRLDHLIETFNNVKNLKGPILVHVLTTKGKGYEPAESDPTGFHGLGKFDPDTGEPKKSVSEVPTYTQVFGDTLVRLAQAGPQDRGHHRGHARRHRAGGFPPGVPRPLLRRGHLRTARRHLCRRAWPWKACGRWPPSTPPSCSGPMTRCSTMSACRTCRWSLPWTGPASWAKTAKPTRGSSTSPICAICPTWS